MNKVEIDYKGIELRIRSYMSMIQPVDGKYNLSEELLDSLLIHQKARIIVWLNELETCRRPEHFVAQYNKVMGAIIVLGDLWSTFNYSYKAQELAERIKRIQTTHPLKELMKWEK